MCRVELAGSPIMAERRLSECRAFAVRSGVVMRRRGDTYRLLSALLRLSLTLDVSLGPASPSLSVSSFSQAPRAPPIPRQPSSPPSFILLNRLCRKTKACAGLGWAGLGWAEGEGTRGGDGGSGGGRAQRETALPPKKGGRGGGGGRARTHKGEQGGGGGAVVMPSLSFFLSWAGLGLG